MSRSAGAGPGGVKPSVQHERKIATLRPDPMSHNVFEQHLLGTKDKKRVG